VIAEHSVQEQNRGLKVNFIRPTYVGRDGALFESMTFNQRVVGSTRELTPPLGQLTPWPDLVNKVACL